MKIAFGAEYKLPNRIYDVDRSKYIDLSTGLILELDSCSIMSRLGKKDVKVLTLLVLNNGKLTTREQLLDFGWHGRVVTDSVLNVAISNIRKTLMEFYPESKEIIKTINGLGYCLKLESSVFYDASY